MNKREIAKRKTLIHLSVFLIMAGVLLGTNFIKLDAIWGETTLHEVLSMILFPFLFLNKMSDLANRFVDWLFEIAEE
jgi:hypothetical protein